MNVNGTKMHGTGRPMRFHNFLRQRNHKFACIFRKSEKGVCALALTQQTNRQTKRREKKQHKKVEMHENSTPSCSERIETKTYKNVVQLQNNSSTEFLVLSLSFSVCHRFALFFFSAFMICEAVTCLRHNNENDTHQARIMLYSICDMILLIF